MKPTVTLLLVLVVCLSAADPWQSKPFVQWTDQEVQQVMSNSPWAHEVTISSSSGGGDTTVVTGGGGRRGGISGGSTGSPNVTSTRVVVMWESALPEREAVLRIKYGAEIALVDAKQFLEADDPNYVIIVNGLPASAVRGDPAKVKEAIRKKTTLNTIQPAQVDVFQNGKTAGLYFAFPRTAPLTLSDNDVEFSTKVGDLTVKTKFHLQDMVINGKLEL